MKALLGKERYGEVLVTELGGRKRDRKKMVMDGLGGTKDASRQDWTSGFQKGSVPRAGPPKHLGEMLREGMLEPGNIDLYNRPDVDGSTVRSMSFEEEGREVLIPTVVGDRILSDDDAISEYERTGQHMGVFDSPENATAYAKAVHEDYESGRIPTPEYQEGNVPAYAKSPMIDWHRSKPDLYQKYTDLRQGKLFDMLTGASPQEISQRVSQGESPYQGPRRDLQTHALASRLMGERLGVPAARALGFANEVGGGLVGLAKGEGFLGELGFDLQDLNANEVGLESLNQPSLSKSLRYLLTNR